MEKRKIILKRRYFRKLTDEEFTFFIFSLAMLAVAGLFWMATWETRIGF